MRYIGLITAMVFSIFFFSSCVDEITEDMTQTVDYLPMEITSSTLFGQVRDESGFALEEVSVSVINASNGIQSVKTDDSGFFAFYDIKTKGPIAKLEVRSAGKFTQFRNIPVVADEIFELDFTLATYNVVASFQAEEGGTITMDSDITIEFPASSIRDENGNIYDGEVDVFAHDWNTNEPAYRNQAFGGYFGINRLSEQVAVLPFQSIQLEMRSPSGQLLQIREGFEATMRAPAQPGLEDISDNLGIMVWDEDEGHWIESGEAFFNNGVMEARVPHFSTWTWCEILSNGKTFSGDLDLIDGGQIFEAKSYVFCDFGPITFYVPSSQNGEFYFPFFPTHLPFNMYVLDDCEEDVLYEQEYAPILDDTHLGKITIEADANDYSRLTATILNCDSTLVNSAYVRFRVNELTYSRSELLTVDNGQIEHYFLNCDQPLTGRLSILNEENLLTTEPISVDLSDGDVDLGLVSLCDTFTQHITLNIEGNQILSATRIWYGASVGGPDDVTQHFSGEDRFSSLCSFNVDAHMNAVGTYTNRLISVRKIHAEGDPPFKEEWRTEDNGLVTIEVTEYVPREDDPDNPFFKPKLMKGTFNGMINEYDPDSNTFGPLVEISGTFELSSE